AKPLHNLLTMFSVQLNLSSNKPLHEIGMFLTIFTTAPTAHANKSGATAYSGIWSQSSVV
ncbi:hypothetical protein CHS0354_042665, partial [Potamilus streckersoni]